MNTISASTASLAALCTLVGAALASAPALAAGPNGPNLPAVAKSGVTPLAKPGKPKIYDAVVEAAGTLTRGTATSASPLSGEGTFQVNFPVDVSQCSYHATIGNSGTGFQEDGAVTTALRAGVPTAVFVATYNPDSTRVARPFHLAVICS